MKITEEQQKAKEALQQPPTKVIKVADLEKFEVFVHAPCYKQLKISGENYFIDLITGEKLGQELLLAIYPDGTLEQPHHAVYEVATGEQHVLDPDEIPYTVYYRNYLKQKAADK